MKKEIKKELNATMKELNKMFKIGKTITIESETQIQNIYSLVEKRKELFELYNIFK